MSKFRKHLERVSTAIEQWASRIASAANQAAVSWLVQPAVEYWQWLLTLRAAVALLPGTVDRKNLED